MKSYFLTGATGVVGSAIVPLLLDESDATLRLLIRAKTDEELERRVQSMLTFWGWERDLNKRDRILALRGDTSEPCFALSKADYQALSTETTHIIHCAASVRMNLPLEKARRSAVGSAREILALARLLRAAGCLSKVDFVSTVGVAGRRPGILPETWIDQSRGFHNSYEQSKAESEIVVRRAVEQEGIPLTLHRPSMVVGDSRTGRTLHHQVFYFICEFLSGRKTLGLYPNLGDVRLDVIPVDWVAEMIVASSRDTDTTGRIFNLCSGPEKSPLLTEIKALVRSEFRSHGLRIPPDLTLSRRVFAKLPALLAAMLPARRRSAMATVPVYLDYLMDMQGFGNGQYQAYLQGQGLQRSEVTPLLPTIIRNYLRSRYR